MAAVECHEPLAAAEADTNHRGGATPRNPMLAEIEAPWANSRFFSADVVALGAIAGALGVISYGYGFVVGDLLNRWLTWAGDGKEYPEKYLEEGGLGAPLWIPLCWLGGTMVGLLKVLVGLDTFDTFLVEIRHQHCDALTGLKTFVCCIASLASGAAMGPEAGLAAIGGCLGTSFAGQLARLGPLWAAQADERRRLYVLGGICAAFGTIMPSPWVSLLICMECSMLKIDPEGKELRVFGRRTLFLLGYVATVAWVVRYAVKEIPQLPNVAAQATGAGEAYDNIMPLKAILLGAIAAVSAVIYAVVGAIVKVIFTKLGACIEGACGRSVRVVALCSLAGLLTGVLGYLAPMSLSSGKEAMFPMIKYGGSWNKAAVPLAASSLLWIAVSKTLSYSVAAAGGMVGGPFFPILFIGVVVGQLAARIPLGWSVYPDALTIPVMMVSIPSSVFPVPFTMVAIPLSFFHLGTLWCVPILVGIITSYTLVVGSGFVQELTGRR